MKNEKYYIGLDVGTNSVGYAVSDENYELCKFKGEPMWGVSLFDEAQQAAGRRKVRAARRRLDRRQQRVQLIMDLFAEEICKVDSNFYKRIKESYYYPTSPDEKVRLFDTYSKQKEYNKKYPTIHHLIVELMNDKNPHDVRLVFLACAWLVAHRGHFLSQVDKQNIEAVIDFNSVFENLNCYIQRDIEYVTPWQANLEVERVEEVLKTKTNIKTKCKELSLALFGNSKAPKSVDEQYEFNYELVLKLLCGGKVLLKDLFAKEEYAELEEKSVKLDWDDVKLAQVMQDLGDDAELISVLKAVYDWSVLVDALGGKESISEAKVMVYKQHQLDLQKLKYFIKKYVKDKYNEVFRARNVTNNYVAYIGKNHTNNEKDKVKKSVSREDFCKYIISLLKGIKPDKTDSEEFNNMMSRLEVNDFMKKQVDGDNRVIPYQLYWYEINKILNNAKEYHPFLNNVDEDGISVMQKIISVFEFKIPYYVGPLKEKSDKKLNHWMVRKASGKIYPWNFNNKVDLDASEDAFIRRMTNTCTYVAGEDVLPKCSLVYSAFEVLNEINNIKINEHDIDVALKQELYEKLFSNGRKVTLKGIENYLRSNNYMNENDAISGIDVTVKSSLKSYAQFKNLIEKEILSHKNVEDIINRSTYTEDKVRLGKWLNEKYPQLSEVDCKYIAGLKLDDFGRLSKKLLCSIEGTNKETGEHYSSIIRAMWETNNNLMQLLSDKYTFSETIEELNKEYYGNKKKSITEQLDDMYVSNAVKRPIIRSLDILKDVVKVKKCAPERIFIEMARGTNEDLKGKRTKTRYEQILELYKEVDNEDVRTLSKQLEEWGEAVHSKLQSDKLFLYFIQLGKCLYTGKSIDINSLIAGDGTYNIDHIRPRSIVKDDSIINNLVLVDSKENERKGDLPVPSDIVEKMKSYWTYLNKKKLISDEKFKRLNRTTQFTNEEKFEFINRQLVETRQSTKALATLLKNLYPDTEIVYVKAGLVSEFRKQFDLPKSRVINDLHHGKDAYLNIVTGNIWHCKFSRKFWKSEENNNAKTEIVFTHPVFCNGKKIWNGAVDKERIVKIAKKNAMHLTMFPYIKYSGQNGGLFDQNPVSASKDLVPLKKDRPTEIYGGYNSSTVAGFILVKYKDGKKSALGLVPLKLLDMERFVSDDQYAKQYISNELGEKAKDVEILLNKRIIKIYTMLSLDGARYYIRGKGSATELGLMNAEPFIASYDIEQYMKKTERISEKYKKNPKYVWDEKYDGVTTEKNLELYEQYIQKLSCWPFNTRPGNRTFTEKLNKHLEDFRNLDVFKQVYTLLQIQGIFCREKQADLRELKESASSGIAKLSLNLTNWGKSYTDVRIIDQSASSLFETMSDNLLELL